MTTLETVVAIVGMAVLTLLTRGFFVLPRRQLPLPGWLHEALRYAPLGALLALILPEVIMKDGAVIATWRDPRLVAAAVGIAWFAWRRDILGTIVTGTAALLVMRLGCGW